MNVLFPPLSFSLLHSSPSLSPPISIGPEVSLSCLHFPHFILYIYRFFLLSLSSFPCQSLFIVFLSPTLSFPSSLFALSLLSHLSLFLLCFSSLFLFTSLSLSPSFYSSFSFFVFISSSCCFSLLLPPIFVFIWRLGENKPLLFFSISHLVFLFVLLRWMQSPSGRPLLTQTTN